MKIQLEDVAKKLKIHSGSFFIKSNYWKRGEKTKVEHSETITVADLRAAVFSFISKNSFGCWHKMGYLIRRYELSADNTTDTSIFRQGEARDEFEMEVDIVQTS
jgi:hypothetical protein